jgi:predicted tellurium resistance membrane protein TerC
LYGCGEEHVQGGSTMKEAIRTVIIADLVMSLDNVVAVAGVANGLDWD